VLLHLDAASLATDARHVRITFIANFLLLLLFFTEVTETTTVDDRHYTKVPFTNLLSGKINLGLHMWVKCGFSSAATSAFYIFKIRTSADPHFTPGQANAYIAYFLSIVLAVDRRSIVKGDENC